MKQKLLSFLFVFAAFLTAIPIANAAPEDYVIKVNTTPLANYSANWIGEYVSKQITASNGVIYGIMPGSSRRISYYNTSTKSDGSWQMSHNTGWGSSVDDNGNLIIANGNYDIKVTKVIVFAKSASWGTLVSSAASRTIDLSAAYTTTLGSSGRTDFWEASGNLLNGTGYLWFTDGAKVVRLTVSSTGSVSQSTFSVPSSYANTEKATESRFFPIDNGKYILQNRAGVFQCAISGSTLTVEKEIVDDRNQACDIITLREHQILVRNNQLSSTADASRNGLIDIYDITQSKSLATGLKGAVNESGGMTFNAGAINVWCELEKKNDNTVYLYTHLPTTGMRAFEITATSNFITNVKASLSDNNNTKNIKVTWTKPASSTPSKYRVSYSKNGGSSWTVASDNVTTTEYTLANVEFASSTYLFKVEPYYTSSAKWGQNVTSNTVTISDPTNPVVSLSAALVSGSTNDAVVSWAKPSLGNATKYAVSYSTNGGTTWSTAVETNNLNYTFNDLADGTYVFKVKPFYTVSWGEESTSNSVTIVNYTDPVTNMQVQAGSGMPYSAIVNWGAPSGEGTPTKYAVSYSTNGGTSWSTAVETTGLTYTYSGLAQGEYIFKVTPYYGTTAGEATTKTATVYGVTTPVPAVNVAYYNNIGNSIAVSWTAPEGSVAPDKYQVCYTSNGGSSWSAAVETNDLAYTFSNLPVGTYNFKVTPVYNGVAGEAAISENINSLAPTGYTFTTSKRWDVAGTWGTDAAPDGRSIAVSNNMMYVASPNTDTKIAHISQGTSSSSWPSFDTGFAKQTYGLAMDNDDAGNIIMSSGTYFGSSGGFAQFTIYPAGATSNASKVDIALEGDYLPGSRCDFIAAQGNLLSSAGGYVWLAPNTGQKIMRIKIANGALAGITTWTQTISSTTNTNQIVLRPLDDGRLYFHLRSSGYKIITLPAAGEEITADMVETISATGYSNVNSDMFTLLGYTFHVRNDGAASQSIGVEIKNLTDAGNGDAAFTPFEGKTPAGGNSSVTKIDGYGSLVRAVNVNEYTTDVYCYTINHGVTVYRVTANPVYTVTGAIKSLDYEYTTVETEEGTRQDVTLTWTAPEEATPTSYKVYRDGTLIATVASPALTYTDQNVNANHTYTVLPYFAGVAEDASLGLSVTTSEVETVLWAPVITEMRTYNGYSIAQFFFKMPSLSKVKPLSFNIYRDEQLIESGITQYNYIDDNLPKKDENKEYTYYVEAVYSDTYDNATRKSVGEPVTVTYRDWSLAGYMIEEIYNVPINQVIGNLPNNFTNYDYYRQGQFYDGHWYIAQRADDLCQKDQDKANGITNSVRDDMKSDNADATGGVVVIKATEEPDVRMGFAADNKIITNDAFENVGIAMDDAGNIFMRNNNITKLAATTPADGNATEVAKLDDGFGRRITEGHLYTRNDDGSYSETPTTIDLTALWLDNRWIDDMVYTSGKSYGQVIGRSDYYHMWGDVMSAEGGYLILAPSWTRTAFKVKIANGAYVSHEVIEFSNYSDVNPTTGELEEHILATGSENYGFKIAGRESWMAQIRSNGYFGVHDDEVNADGSKHWHAIFDTDSRINNSGGTSIVAFGNAEDDSDGETFLITPACMYSKNTGDFIVTRGIKNNIGDAAAEAQLAPPMPVAQFKQVNTSSNIATNANGNWFHAEPGTYESATEANAECVYIYQYVPGMRFAKYRLFPDNQLPQVFPTLEITTKYDKEVNPTEITHFGGVSTWKRPKNFGLSDASNANVKVKSYTFELLDAKNNVIYTDEVLDKDYEAGTNPSEESENFVYEFDYFTDKNIATVDQCDLDFQTYTARVAVNYEFSNGTIKQSQFNSAIDNNDYPAEPVKNLATFAFKQANQTIDEWVEKDGQWVVEQKQVDNYRVEIDFDKPDCDEPVSHYTVKALVNNKTDMIDITDFHLHNGMEVVNGIEQAILERDAEGNVIPTSVIPGTYDFDGSKAPYYHQQGVDFGIAGQSRQNSVLTWHFRVPAGSLSSGVATASNGEEIVITDEPDKWTFIVVAHYAAKNAYIDKNREADAIPGSLIETGVEVVGADNASSLEIYPIPASTSITIKSPEAINSIVIYNEAGAEVMNLDGDNEMITTVNIESLATGYYFVKVNNQALVKIIKK